MHRSTAAIFALALLTAWPLAAQRAAVPPAPPARAGRAARPAPVERRVPFKVGETLTFDVSWSAFLTAGTIVATVQEKRPSLDSTAYYIVAEGRPTPLVSRLYPLYYKMDTLIDAFTLLSQRGSLYSEEGGRHALRTTTFDRRAQTGSFEYKASTTERREFSIPPGVQDVLSAVYAIRTMPLTPGDRTPMAISNDGTTYKLRFEIARPERLRTAFGDQNAWKLSPIAEDAKNPLIGRNLSIWLTDDARRLPVKLQGDLPVGAFVLTLREVK
jgi:hypothetical protein